jgi:hypothetical protein
MVSVPSLLFVCASLAHAVRLQSLSEQDTSTTHEVSLLVIRHGLSCSNYVEHWVSKLDVGRGFILDPLLGGIGEYGARESGRRTMAWLKERNATLDATISSVLARAIETSLLAFPGHDQKRPLLVAPFIRELASGDSNRPRDPAEQLTQLVKRVPAGNTTVGVAPFQVDYKWSEVFGASQGGDWDKFIKLLENSLLPELVQKLRKPSGSHIVLAVTTHSLLMKKHLSNKCGRFFEGKPLNNQVLHVPYTFRTIVPPAGRFPDKTVRYELKESAAPCENVAPGSSLKDAKGQRRDDICLRDIGDSCIEPIMAKALAGTKLYDVTLEHKMIHLAAKLGKNQINRPKLQKLMDQSMRLFHAEDQASEPNSSHVLARAYMSRAKQTQADIEAIDQDLESDPKMLQNLAQTQCWIGGLPNSSWYLELRPDVLDDLPPLTLEIQTMIGISGMPGVRTFVPPDEHSTSGVTNSWEATAELDAYRAAEYALEYYAVPDDFVVVEEKEAPKLNVPINGGLGDKCLQVSKTYSESTCGVVKDKDGHTTKLKCYLSDKTRGEQPERNQEGICFIPRKYSCDALLEDGNVKPGCRPGSVCKPNTWSSGWSCHDE